jgi:hypothetical protein
LGTQQQGKAAAFYSGEAVGEEDMYSSSTGKKKLEYTVEAAVSGQSSRGIGDSLSISTESTWLNGEPQQQ